MTMYGAYEDYVATNAIPKYFEKICMLLTLTTTKLSLIEQ